MKGTIGGILKKCLMYHAKIEVLTGKIPILHSDIFMKVLNI
jgi:hypothetical protein